MSATRKRFLDNFESFLSLCEKHHIQMMPVIFDSCFGEFPDLEKYRDKDWMACPGQNRLGPEHWPAMQKYVRDVVGRHKDDQRIVMWDVMNEPYVTSFNTEADRRTIHTFLGQALEMARRQQPANRSRSAGNPGPRGGSEAICGQGGRDRLSQLHAGTPRGGAQRASGRAEIWASPSSSMKWSVVRTSRSSWLCRSCARKRSAGAFGS